jgi:hypothetical protein
MIVRLTRANPLCAQEETAPPASVVINLATLAATGGDGWFSGLSWRYVTGMQVGNARLLYREICTALGWIDEANRPRPFSKAVAERWAPFDPRQTELRTRAQIGLVRVQLANQIAAGLFMLLQDGHAWRAENVYWKLVFQLRECRWHLAREHKDTAALDLYLRTLPRSAREAVAWRAPSVELGTQD